MPSHAGFPEGLKETPDKRKMESSYGMTWDGSREARRHRERRGDATNRPPGHLHLQPAAPPWNDTEMWGAVTWASVTAWHRVTSRVSTPAPAPPVWAAPPRPPPHWPTWALDLSRRYTVLQSACLVTPRDTWHHFVTVILSPQPQWRRMRHSILATKEPLRILTEWEVCVSGELRRTFSFYRIIIWEKESIINSTLVPLMYKFKLKTENWQCKLAQATLSVLYVLMVSYKNRAFSYTYHIISMRI